LVAFHDLSPSERDRATLVTANYGQAAGINRFGPALGVPRASSGHMTFFLWGPAVPTADVLVTVGLDRPWLLSACDSLTLAGESDHPLARLQERHLPIHICRGLRTPLLALWPTLKRFDHRLQPPPPR
jgi:hypothetical protein